MNSLPQVSVVMSVYNEVSRVEAAVRSILDQSLKSIELIVVDDGSRDGSCELLDRIAVEDSRLRVIRQANAGLTCALIRACGEAKAEYIARQDADDWSFPRRIEEQVALLEANPKIGFVSCATEYVGPRDEFLLVVARPADPEIATQGLLLSRQGPPAHGSVMFRRSVYDRAGGYRSQFLYSQDSDLWLRMGELSWIGYLDAVRYRHRKDPQSISGSRRAQQSEFARLAHACRADRLASRSEQGNLSRAQALADEIRMAKVAHGDQRARGSLEIHYLIASQLVSNGDPRARAHLWQVIVGRPWHWRAWVRLAQSFFRRPLHSRAASKEIGDEGS
ncbi:MAG: glycosyltransferase family 2 protein [Pseudomarimonas sp.]